MPATRRAVLAGGASAALSLLRPLRGAAGGSAERYLATVRRYADAMIEHGRDTYGRQRSPLFASTLDRKTLKLPAQPVPKVPGIRSGDRCTTGANVGHDHGLYRLLYALTAVTGERRYAGEADAALKWFFTHCQSPATGLLAWGEHLGWDFTLEGPIPDRDIHEFFGPWSLWERSFALAPEACRKFAAGLWRHQIADQRKGLFSRHARYTAHGPESGAEFPRHGGFFIVTWAEAYAQTKDSELLRAIEVLAASFQDRRHPASGAIPNASRSDLVWPPGNVSLAISLEESAPKLPAAAAEKLRACAAGIDASFLKTPHDLSPKGSGFVMAASAATLEPGDPRDRERKTKPFTHTWASAYGEGMHAQIAAVCLHRFDQTKAPGYRDLVLASAARYLELDVPQVARSQEEEALVLYPGALAAAIYLLLGAHRITGEKKYLDRADRFGERALDIFWRGSALPAASSAHGHYETVTGGDELALVLLQLWARLARPGQPPPAAGGLY